jgi:hypothetical protein
MAAATGVILVAGTITFSNEWYQTGKVNWRIPVATMLAAAIFDGLAKVDERAALGLSVIALIGAFTTKFNGKSVADTVSGIMSNSTPVRKPTRPEAV